MDADLTRERGLWGPPFGSRLDKWTMDMVEGDSRTFRRFSVRLDSQFCSMCTMPVHKVSFYLRSD